MSGSIECKLNDIQFYLTRAFQHLNPKHGGIKLDSLLRGIEMTARAAREELQKGVENADKGQE